MTKRLVTISLAMLAGPLLVEEAFGQRPASARAVERLVREVRHELVTLPYYSVFDNLEYKVDGYTVTLLGQVTRPTLKSDAEKAVQQIEGVEKVVNQIEVLPLSPMDDASESHAPPRCRYRVRRSTRPTRG